MSSADGRALVDRVTEGLNRVGWVTNAAGVLVICASIVVLMPILSDEVEPREIALANVPAIVVLYVLVGKVIDRVMRRLLDRALAWITEERRPDRNERRRTLRLAILQTQVCAGGWMVAAVIFSLFNGIAYSWEFGLVVAGTIWLGAEMTSALEYLLAERVLRPVTALALADEPGHGHAAPGVRVRLTMAWLLGTGVPLVGVVVVGFVALTKPDVDTDYVAAAVLFLGAVAMVVGSIATIFAAKAIAHPVTAVRRGLERISSGDLDVRIPVDDGSEVGQLQAGFNRMAEGLRERERIRDLFGRHVGEEVAHRALRDGVRFGGEEREVGALYIDLVGSTSMALAMPPTELVRVLNRFFRVVVDVVESDGGLVNKFAGDAALCVFGAPVPREDPSGDALRAARVVAARLRREVPEIDFGIGISAGIVVAGNVGAEKRFEYTVVGDPVNEAARLAELAKHHSDRVLASQAALDRANGTESASWRVGDSARLRGRTATTGVAFPRS